LSNRENLNDVSSRPGPRNHVIDGKERTKPATRKPSSSPSDRVRKWREYSLSTTTIAVIIKVMMNSDGLPLVGGST
jgi:hypothetical protein